MYYEQACVIFFNFSFGNYDDIDEHVQICSLSKFLFLNI